MNIGNKIMNLRKKNNLSQEELAFEVGVTRQTISKWELNETVPDIKQAKKLSNIFKVSLDELVDNDIKNILLEKASNTEKLSGIIIKILKIIGILFVSFLLIIIVLFIISLINHKTMDELIDSNASITCQLHDEEYGYSFEYNEESGEIITAGGDGYFANIIGIDKYHDIHEALDNINEYVVNHGGTCTISDSHN